MSRHQNVGRRTDSRPEIRKKVETSSLESVPAGGYGDQIKYEEIFEILKTRGLLCQATW